MYFPSEDEKKRLLRGLLPKARKLDIPDELRRWNWHRAPLEPIYDVKIALYEVAGKYCSSGRDVYLRRVLGVKDEAEQGDDSGSVLPRGRGLGDGGREAPNLHQGCEEL